MFAARPGFVSLAAAILAATATAGLAQGAACPGRSLIDDLKQSDAQAYDAWRKETAGVPNGKTMLWKIEHAENARPPSYLFGTLHLTDDRVHKLPPAVVQALGDVQRLIIEVSDTNAERLAEGMSTFQANGKLLLPGKDRLDKQLAPAEQQTAVALLTKAGLPSDVAARVQPWAVMAMMMPDCERSRRRAGRLPLDAALADRAESLGLGTVDIETVEMQFEAMARVPEAEQFALLKGQIALHARVNDVVETMIQLYLARDLGALWPLQVALARKAGVDDKAVEAYRTHIISERTSRMALRLSQHLERGGAFIAIGAIHLPGTTGMVQQIMDMGYKVTALE